MKSPSTIVACGVLLLLLSCPSAESRDNVIFSANAGECTLSVESNVQWRTLRLRAHHPSGKNCFIGKETMASVLGEALSKADAPEAAGKFDSLFIGRLVDYPWLSQALAVAARDDQGWDLKRGKPLRVNINRYVSRVLSGEDVSASFDAVLAKGGYKVGSVTVEKVLVGRFRDVPLYKDNAAPGLVPYDAQVWFRLQGE